MTHTDTERHRDTETETETERGWGGGEIKGERGGKGRGKVLRSDQGGVVFLR